MDNTKPNPSNWSEAEKLVKEFDEKMRALGMMFTGIITDTNTGAYIIMANECVVCAVNSLSKWIEENNVKHDREAIHVGDINQITKH